jgi:hypothetical protein
MLARGCRRRQWVSVVGVERPKAMPASLSRGESMIRLSAEAAVGLSQAKAARPDRGKAQGAQNCAKLTHNCSESQY